MVSGAKLVSIQFLISVVHLLFNLIYPCLWRQATEQAQFAGQLYLTVVDDSSCDAGTTEVGGDRGGKFPFSFTTCGSKYKTFP